MVGRVCPACRKNVDSPPAPKPKPEPAGEGAFKLAAQEKHEGTTSSVMFQADRPRSAERTSVPASSGNAIQRLAPKYETYEEVPWYRREPGALVVVLVMLFWPTTVALCIIALTGQVYRKAYDKEGNLRVWGPENKAAAVLILILHCFIIWAVLILGYRSDHAPPDLHWTRSVGAHRRTLFPMTADRFSLSLVFEPRERSGTQATGIGSRRR
jgi:hypothetical protein